MTKILVVEDNEMNLDVLCRRLARAGFQVASAPDGETALPRVLEERPDLVIMDLGLPGIDGLEATRRIKAHAAAGNVPVIVLTAHAMASDRDSALASGCDDFDTKPVEFPRLLSKIQALLGGARP